MMLSVTSSLGSPGNEVRCERLWDLDKAAMFTTILEAELDEPAAVGWFSPTRSVDFGAARYVIT